MPIFISYSHQNKDFAALLASALKKENAHVWLDSWELNVGDSLISRIQQAIQESSALLVVLSKAAVESEWCKKEMTAGLFRELSEKKVIVLPILLEDCNIPLFLREKVYADFRTDFDEGLKAVVKAIARFTNDSLGRIETENGYADFAIDWFYKYSLFHFRITFVIVDTHETVLTEVKFTLKKSFTKWFQQYEEKGHDWLARQIVMEHLNAIIQKTATQFKAYDQVPVEYVSHVLHPDTRTAEFDVKVTCRRLGEDNGREVLVQVKRLIYDALKHVRATSRLTEEQSALLAQMVLPYTDWQPKHTNG